MDKLLNRILAEFPILSLESKGCLPPCVAAYLVIANNVVFYVGQTTNLHRRWLNHHRFKEFQKLENVQICWLEVDDPSLLRQLEKSLIQFFDPEMHWKNLGETKRLTINIPVSLHQAFKQKAAGEGKTLAGKVSQLICDYLEEE